MRDIKSYFGSNVLDAPTNSGESFKDANSSFAKHTKKKRQREADDAVSAQQKRKTLNVRRSSRNLSSDSAMSYAVVDNNSSGDEFTRESNTRKRTRRKSSIKEDLNTSVNSTDDTSTKQESNLVTARVLKGIVIEDCMNSSSTSLASNRKRAGRKRRKNESVQSGLDSTDSSEDVFESQFKERPRKTYSKKSVSRETKEENNLFNYFLRTENSSTAQSDSKLLESPVDCLKKVQVVVQVHSPPRARVKKPKKSMTNEIFTPTIKLVRTKAMKTLNLDLIEVIGTEDVSPLKTNPNRQQEECSRPPKTESNSRLEDGDEDSDSSTIFTNAKRATVSVRKLVLEDSDSASSSEERCASTKNKSERTLPKSDLCETDCTSFDHESKDTVWRMRVQLAPKNVIHSKPKKSKLKGTNENSFEEEEDEAEEIKQSKNKPKEVEQPLKQKKLASLFCKSYKKKSDCIVNVDNEARKLFLSSGLPEVVKKKFEEQKNVPIDEETFTCYTFPAVSHVQQKSEHFIWYLTDVDLGLKTVAEDICVSRCPPFVTFIDKGMKVESDSSEKENFDLKDEIAALKKLEPAVNVGDVYSSVKRLYNEAESTDTICWTDKYKPSNCDDLMGNKANLIKLKEWIESHKRLKIVYSDRDSSSEEFVDSDDSSHNSRMKDNVAILAGPPGCGKTCAVYTLSKELGFEVLEVNAASNRDGKRLLDELLEATQSHRVKRATIFEKAAKDKKSSQKKKRKKKSEEVKRERKTMSLILIEDADILFENYDEGFLSALSTLARESKRPLIFTVNDLNCTHLNKYRNNLVLQFEYPSRSRINVWLKVIALTEGVKLSDAVLIDLFHIAGLDVRKSLLQLQMLISSKLCHSILDGEKLFYQDWCRRVVQCEKQPTLPETEPEDRDNDDIFSPKKGATIVEARVTPSEEPRGQEISQSDREMNRRLLNDHAKFMDIVTLLGHLESNHSENTPPRASDSLHEDLLSADICSLLKQKAFANFENSTSSISFSEYYELVRKNSKIKSVYQNMLSNLNVPLLDCYPKYCDLLPTLRCITRFEQSKQGSQQKRTSRFFSYLKSVNIHVNDQEMEFLRDSMI